MSEQPESSRPRKRQRRLVRPGDDSDDDSEASSISTGSPAPATGGDQDMAPVPRRGPQLLQGDSDDDDDDDNAGGAGLPRRPLGRRANANVVGAMLAGNGGGGDPDDNDSDGEDLEDNDERDYRAIPELDRYADADLDEDDYDPISMQARNAAERLMSQRDAEQARRGVRMPGALADSSDDDDDDEEGDGQVSLCILRLS
jgi:hypothetical protein